MEHSNGEHAFPNFCAVTDKLSRLEWLDPSKEGHQRCFFGHAGGSSKGTWIAP